MICNNTIQRGLAALECLTTRLSQIAQRRKANQYPDDVFLISFPKSGNTWVRFLIANLIMPEREVNFHTIHEIVPDFDRKTHRTQIPKPRVFKSHSTYCAVYPNVIYIVRDGRDVSLSYYEFLKGKKEFKGSFLDFLRNEKFGPTAWSQHVNSWLDNSSNTNYLLIKYEDLLRDTRTYLKQMTRFIGLKANDEDIAYAVNKSSFEQMKWLEGKRGRLYKQGEEDIFMRKGRMRCWKDHFTDKQLNLFEKLAGRTLARLGYN